MKRVLSNNFYMLRFIARSCPVHIILTVFQAILTSTASVFNILVLKLIVDSLSSADNLRRCIFYILLIALLDISVTIVRSALSAYYSPKNEQIIRKEMRLSLMNKAMSIEFRYYDDQEFYNKFDMAIAQSDTRAMAVLNSFSLLISSLFSIGALSTLLATMNPALILFAILGAGISITIRTKAMKLQHDYAEESIPIQRQMSYIQRIIYLKEYIQEINLNPDSSELIEKKYLSSVKDMFSLIKQYARRLFCSQTASSGVSVVVSTLTMIYLAFQVFAANISLGSFIAMDSSATQLFNQFRSLTEGIFQLYEHNLYIENFREFMEIQSVKNTGACKLSSTDQVSITVQNMSFSYANSSRNAVQDINLHIKPGEKIALVGYNGSGKSTLIKLLLGMYAPSGGEIIVNDINIINYDYADYLNTFGVVLQDFRFFSFTIAENILMRPIQNKEVDERIVWDALSFVKMADKVSSLPQQINTPVSREFNSQGAIFSGGELQRLAIARAYAKNTPILILDEPSSALDPVAESEIIDLMFTLGKEKTLILISHRLDNLKLAGRILVMDNGEIVEDGNHENLLRKDGLYAKLLKAARKESSCYEDISQQN